MPIHAVPRLLVSCMLAGPIALAVESSDTPPPTPTESTPADGMSTSAPPDTATGGAIVPRGNNGTLQRGNGNMGPAVEGGDHGTGGAVPGNGAPATRPGFAPPQRDGAPTAPPPQRPGLERQPRDGAGAGSVPPGEQKIPSDGGTPGKGTEKGLGTGSNSGSSGTGR